jgi:hypothetical protein
VSDVFVDMMHQDIYMLFRICISVPIAGDRVPERGMEQLVDLVRGSGELHATHCHPFFLNKRQTQCRLLLYSQSMMYLLPGKFGDLDAGAQSRPGRTPK